MYHTTKDVTFKQQKIYQTKAVSHVHDEIVAGKEGEGGSESAAGMRRHPDRPHRDDPFDVVSGNALRLSPLECTRRIHGAIDVAGSRECRAGGVPLADVRSVGQGRTRRSSVASTVTSDRAPHSTFPVVKWSWAGSDLIKCVKPSKNRSSLMIII